MRVGVPPAMSRPLGLQLKRGSGETVRDDNPAPLKRAGAAPRPPPPMPQPDGRPGAGMPPVARPPSAPYPPPPYVHSVFMRAGRSGGPVCVSCGEALACRGSEIVLRRSVGLGAWLPSAPAHVVHIIA